jgi:hypothetical protein
MPGKRAKQEKSDREQHHRPRDKAKEGQRIVDDQLALCDCLFAVLDHHADRSNAPLRGETISLL